MNYTVRSSLRELYDIYSQNRVHRYAAAFSYYVTLSIFPFIIIVSIMIAPLHVDLIELADVIGRVVPDSVIEILLNHLQYVSNNNSGLMLWSAIVVLCTTASGAFRVLMDIMKDIHGESRFSGFFGFIFSFVLAIGVLVFIYITSLLMVTGGWVMNLLEVHFGFSILTSIWMWLRYLLLFPLAFIFLQFVYSITLPKGNHKHSRTIGAIVATVFIVIVSIGTGCC